MGQQNMPSIASQIQAPVTLKLPYAPPQATFVPLKLEERLLACEKVDFAHKCKQPYLLS
jgi:hypothetical protein